jgi:hypothetical protein
MHRHSRDMTCYDLACSYVNLKWPRAAAMTRKTIAEALTTDRDDEWGEFVLEAAEPHAGKPWTDSGNNRDRRQLKQRAVGEVRRVPCRARRC